MAKTGTTINVIGRIGTVPDIRAQLSALAKRNGTSLPQVAKKLGVTKQRLYSLLSGEQITEDQLRRVLQAIGGHDSDIAVMNKVSDVEQDSTDNHASA